MNTIGYSSGLPAHTGRVEMPVILRRVILCFRRYRYGRIGFKQRISFMQIGTPLSPTATRVMLLGSGKLGREVIIALQRLGVETIAARVHPVA